MAESKTLLQSKTVVVNLVALVAILGSFGLNLDAETVAGIAAVALPVVNVGLRLITKQPVDLFVTKDTDAS